MLLTENQSPQDYVISNLVPDAFIIKEKPEISHDAPYRIAMRKGSFAVSSDAASMWERMKELEIELLSCQTYKKLVNSATVMDLFQMHLDLAGVEKTWEQELTFEDRELVQLENRLLASFEAEPVEDGMDHPAERIIRNVLENSENQNVLDLFSTFSLNMAHPSFAASVLRCLGRQAHLGTTLWRTELVRDALKMSDIEIRDAAVQAAELWGDDEIRNVLEQHSESELWLRDYITDVIADMSG